MDTNMYFRPLGRTGLLVSALSLGTMEFGSKIDEVEAVKILDAAIEAGINSVDTADVYASGRSEEVLGRAIRHRRDSLLLCTKFSVPTDSEDPNSGGTSRRTVIAACEARLRRLGTDHLDIYHIHRPFTQTAIDETLRALDDLVRAGKIRYIGTSGTGGWQLVHTLWAAKDLGLNRPVVEQVAYSLLDRRAERDMLPAAVTHETALTVWSPSAGGLLTGKYLDRQAVGGRLAPDDAWGAKHFTPQANAAVGKSAEVARRQDVTLTAFSLAWTLQRAGITGVVVGPRSTCQLNDQLAALDVALEAEVVDSVDQIVPPGSVTVPYYLDDSFADFRPHPYRW